MSHRRAQQIVHLLAESCGGINERHLLVQSPLSAALHPLGHPASHQALALPLTLAEEHRGMGLDEPRPVILLDVSMPLTSREVNRLQVHLMDQMLHDLHLPYLEVASQYSRASAVFVFHPHQEPQAKACARAMADYIHFHYHDSPLYPDMSWIALYHAIFDPVTRNYLDPIPDRLSTIPF